LSQGIDDELVKAFVLGWKIYSSQVSNECVEVFVMAHVMLEIGLEYAIS
jgi:hypothetical protein